jgi:hypothetical protein
MRRVALASAKHQLKEYSSDFFLIREGRFDQNQFRGKPFEGLQS